MIDNEHSGKYKYSTHHTFIHKTIYVLALIQISMKTFQKWQDEFIACLNEINWLYIEIAIVGQGYEKRYVDSHSVVRVIDEQGEAIGRLHKTIQNATKNTNIMSTTMGGMSQDLQSYGKRRNITQLNFTRWTNALRLIVFFFFGSF